MNHFCHYVPDGFSGVVLPRCLSHGIPVAHLFLHLSGSACLQDVYVFYKLDLQVWLNGDDNSGDLI